MRRTKIVCTIGPATRGPESLRLLLAAGMNVARLNFSHGSHDQHAEVIGHLRRLASEMDLPLALLQDLSGPKVRVGDVAGEGVLLRPGAVLTLTQEDVPGDEHRVNLPVPEIFEAVGVGTHLMLDDGLMELRVTAKRSSALVCEVVVGGLLTSHKGVNVPGVTLPIAAVTDKDLEDLRFGIAQRVDYVAASFVRSASDIAVLRGVCEAARAKIPLIAKIEKHEAISNIDAIMEAVDGIMVARGDLGVEVPIDEVPIIQKMLIHKANRAGKPVITATQMLDSMIRNPRPTRAEVTDVANAIFDGTDAVMLSGETAAGSYPLEAVETMSRIVSEAETFLGESKPGRPMSSGETGTGWSNEGWITPITEAIVDAASLACRRLNAALLVVATRSGRTAFAASKYRNPTPTLALAEDAETARALALCWGVNPLVAPGIADVDHALAVALDWAKAHHVVKPGDRVVLVRGSIPGNPTHNALVVREAD